MNWLEVEGPLSDTWPPKSYQAVFGGLPFEVADGQVRVMVSDPNEDARRLLLEFQQRFSKDEPIDVEPFVQVFRRAMELEQGFTNSMIVAVSALLCSPEFLFLEASTGKLDSRAFRQRLAYFLWNGPPDDNVMARDVSGGASDEAIDENLNRMLEDSRVERFVSSFLDYWLDLRDINANTPDAALYPEYYLDEMLTESSILETRLFFRELMMKNLPARFFVNADFAFVN